MFEGALEMFREIQRVADICLEEVEKCGLNEESFETSFYNVVEELEYTYNLQMRHGISKGVLFDENYDFVFKFPFDENFDGYALTYDYCDLEALNYSHAIDNGVEKFFTKTCFFDTLKTSGGVRLPVYIQARVLPFESLASTSMTPVMAKQYLQEKAESYTGTDRLPPIWISDFIDIYGEEGFDALGEFLDKFGINDLHGNNVGYTPDCLPIIFNFSGYDDFTHTTSSTWNY